MTNQQKYKGLLYGLLIVVLMGTIGSPYASAQVGDDVDVTVTIANYYEIEIPGDAQITMNPVTFDAIGSEDDFRIRGTKTFYIICNTPIRVQTLDEIHLYLGGVSGGPNIGIFAEVAFDGTAIVDAGTNGDYSYVDLDAGEHNTPTDHLTLWVDTRRVWTVATPAGVYTGLVDLEIFPYQ